jgi:hypothetical protein
MKYFPLHMWLRNLVRQSKAVDEHATAAVGNLGEGYVGVAFYMVNRNGSFCFRLYVARNWF